SRSRRCDFGAAVHRPAAPLHAVCAGGVYTVDRRRRSEGLHSLVWTVAMSTVITRMLIAVALAIAAWLSWSESKLAARVAEAKQDIATFNHDNLDALTPQRALSDYLPGRQRRLSDEIRVAKATVAYWLRGSRAGGWA